MELQMRAIDGYQNPDPDKARTGNYVKGDFVMIKEDGFNWGGDDKLPNFCIAKVPTATVAEAIHYINPWLLEISYTINSHDSALDKYNASIKSKYVDLSGNGAITQGMVEAFLTKWNGSVVSTATNEVVFELVMYQAMTSQGIWGVDVSEVVFNEVGYHEPSGAHRIRANYSGWVPPEGNGTYIAKVEKAILDRGGSIFSHDTVAHVIIFDFQRSDIFTAFKGSVSVAVDKIYRRRQYYFSNVAVNAIVTAGGEMTITGPQFLNYTKNRLEE